MQRSCPKSRAGQRGFTMIEMLTVIAIIAILAGILFPVFATVRKNVYKSTCTSNLHQIGVALKLYKDEHNGVYPEALYGFTTVGGNGAAGQQVLGLYPQYVKEPQIFRCPLSPYQMNSNVTLPGVLPDQRYPGKYPQRIYPAWDSYDGQVEPNKIGNPYMVKYERHVSGLQPGYSDNPRQLLYKNPPEDTVVTWCTYHRDYVAGTNEPQTGSLDLVLFLDGHVKPVPSNQMAPMMVNGGLQGGHSYLVGE
jgi:prepilin-type N-terminal cleavage/methylation domain-containing protein